MAGEKGLSEEFLLFAPQNPTTGTLFTYNGKTYEYGMDSWHPYDPGSSDPTVPAGRGDYDPGRGAGGGADVGFEPGRGGSGGTVPAGRGDYDFGRGTGEDEDYSDYFTDPPETLTEEEWADIQGAQEGFAQSIYDLSIESLMGKQKGARRQAGEGLYDIGKQSQYMAGGFAGSGAVGRETGRMRESVYGDYGQTMSDIINKRETFGTQYGKEKFDIKLDIMGKKAAEQDRLNEWYQNQLQAGFTIKQAEPDFDMSSYLEDWKSQLNGS